MVGLPAAVPGKLPTDTPKGPTDTPKGPAGKGIAGWAKANPTLALGSAGIGVVLVVAFVASKTSASQAATSTSAGIDPSTGLPYASAGQSTFDSTGNDIYNAMMAQMGTLESQISALSSSSAATPPVTAPAPPPVTAPTPPPPVAPAPPVGNTVGNPDPGTGRVFYQSGGSTTQQASGPQSTSYTHGQLLYTDPARPWLGTIQTADTTANRTQIAASGGTVTGGY